MKWPNGHFIFFDGRMKKVGCYSEKYKHFCFVLCLLNRNFAQESEQSMLTSRIHIVALPNYEEDGDLSDSLAAARDSVIVNYAKFGNVLTKLKQLRKFLKLIDSSKKRYYDNN